MARNPKLIACTFVTSLVIFLLPYTIFSRSVLDAYPPMVMLALAAAGYSALAVIVLVAFLCSLLSDAHRWLTGASETTAPTPAELEAGTASTAPEPTTPEADTTPTPSTASAKLSINAKLSTKLVMVPAIGLVVLYLLVKCDVVSLDKPLLENIGAALLFFLLGLEVDFAVLVLLFFGALITQGWRSRRGAAAAATATPPTVLFDEGEVAEEAPVTKEEREFKEVEKASA
ncbi:hypothetical protein C8R44DRAFT_794390 [Mycena epipterygia]|nr:hypothetical protein C8R44DRAFT_794390 [Mycena epipterygia]